MCDCDDGGKSRYDGQSKAAARRHAVSAQDERDRRERRRKEAAREEAGRQIMRLERLAGSERTVHRQRMQRIEKAETELTGMKSVSDSRLNDFESGIASLRMRYGGDNAIEMDRLATEMMQARANADEAVLGKLNYLSGAKDSLAREHSRYMSEIEHEQDEWRIKSRREQ